MSGGVTIGKCRVYKGQEAEFLDLDGEFTLSEKAPATVQVVKESDPDARNVLRSLALHNGSGGAIDHAGVGPVFLNPKWIFGVWDSTQAAGDEFGDQTDEAQSVAPDDINPQSAVNGDGSVLAAREKWSGALYAITTPMVDGGGLVEVWDYWNGSAWAALPLLVQPDFAQATARLLFVGPADWEKSDGVDLDLGGIPEGYYPARYRHTTAPDTTPASGDSITLGHPLKFLEQDLVTETKREIHVGAKLVVGDLGEGIMAAFETADADNAVLAVGENYRI